MAFTVNKDPMRGYQISIGSGKKARAKDLQEVAYALMHYFQDGMPGYTDKFNYKKHIEHAKVCSCCPFCREADDLLAALELAGESHP